MKRITLTLFALCLYFVNMQAQVTPSVKIVVTDSLTQSAVPYATAVLKNTKGELTHGGTTNDDGEFILKQLTDKVYHLQITSIGYKNLDTTVVVKNNKQDTYNLVLRPANIALRTVDVTGTVKAFEQRYDRKVYTIKEAQKATARTVLDLLKTMPGVLVNDEDKSITYRGGTPELRVNNIPSFFLYPNISMIPAEKVKKIELIDASNRGGGVLGGIINIILVKPNKEGVDGVLSSEVKQADISHSFAQEHGLNLNYGAGKNIFFGNFMFNDRNNYNLTSRNGYSQNTITGKENILQLDTAKRNSRDILAFLGAMRMVDSLRTDFFTIGFTDNVQETLNNSFVSRGKNEYYYNGNGNTKGNGIGAAYGIMKNFKTPDKTLELNFFANLPIWGKSNATADYTYLNNSPSDYISSNSPNNRMSGMFNFYFNNPLKSGWNLSISETSMFSTTKSHNDRLRNGKTDTLNLTQDKTMFWGDNLNVNIGRVMGCIRLEAGFSFGHSYNKHDYNRYMVVARDTNFMLQKHYFSFNPSINLTWHASETNDFSVKYAYAKGVPELDQLNSYVDKRGVYNWNTGNPDLKPANYHNLSLGYTFSKASYNFSTELLYKQSNNSIVTVGYYLPDNIRLTKPVNIGSTKEFGMTLTNWIQVSSKISMTNSATLNYRKFDQSNLKKEANAFGLDGDQFVFTQFNYDLSSYLTYKFNNRNFASMRVNYYSKSLEDWGYRKPWLNSSINYTLKLLKDDRLKLMFGVDNLTAGLIDRVAVNNNRGTYTTTIEDFGAYHRTFKVAFTYIFEKGDKGTKRFKF